jgi:hypothetical protein
MTRWQLVIILFGVAIFVFSGAHLLWRPDFIPGSEGLLGQAGVALGATLVVGGVLAGRVKPVK